MTTSGDPRVWVLFGKGTGGNGQMKSLADALGWPYEIKTLVHNRLNHVPNVFLGATLATLDRERSTPLEPPWPDLVIAASRRATPVTQWIKKQSGGRTRLVHLLHTQAPLSWFDLVITLPQYRLPERENVLHNIGPLNTIPRERLESEAGAVSEHIGELPRPYTVVLAGGSSSSYSFDADVAARLGREASAHARARGGSLLVTTSPRTDPASADALERAIDGPVHFHRWRRDDPTNPYVGFLGLADDFIVTVDSASLVVEAAATGKPVGVFEWEPKARRRGRGSADGAGAGLLVAARAKITAAVIYLGLVKPKRDFEAYHRAIRARGLAHRLGQKSSVPLQPLDDMDRAVARIRALFGMADDPATTARATPGSGGIGDRSTNGVTGAAAHDAAVARCACGAHG